MGGERTSRVSTYYRRGEALTFRELPSSVLTSGDFGIRVVPHPYHPQQPTSKSWRREERLSWGYNDPRPYIDGLSRVKGMRKRRSLPVHYVRQGGPVESNPRIFV